MLVLGDSCPLPTAGFEKKRKLSEKKFLIYAPMSDTLESCTTMMLFG